MKFKYLLPAIFILITLFSLGWKSKENPNSMPQKSSDVTFYLTKPDKSILFAKQESGVVLSTDNDLPTIEVDENQTFQEMDGFGFTLTGGSAFHFNNMSKEKRHELLTELFAFDNENIGISYLRISLGASDLDAEVFSYNDLPEGESNDLSAEMPELEKELHKDLIDWRSSLNLKASGHIKDRKPQPAFPEPYGPEINLDIDGKVVP